MKYKYSSVDKNNLRWFPKDVTKATLKSIKLIKGKMRGVYPFEMIFKYPISAIAGKNGSGKSTVLSIAACAFHNISSGYKTPNRKYPYYTFSDFFIQSSEEIPPSGINIRYEILHNNWRKSRRFPEGIGEGYQFRKKRKGGKWNNYASRVKRNVIYFGIERVVPHSEKSVSKTYRKTFKREEDGGWEKDVRKIVGKILNKKYEKFWYKKHSKHKLPVVEYRGSTYSGFNMGAGENALFDIFSTILSCDEGMFVIIDEIELGLHEKAQKKFIIELKKLCKTRHIQIICTTHSPVIIENIPPEGRFYIEQFENSTVITPCISSSYASGKLSGENSNELDIYVEDEVAECIVEASLSNEIRHRVNILPIGSSSAIIRQMAARKKDLKAGECVAIFDGDKSKELEKLKALFLKSMESYDNTDKLKKWFRDRVSFLPGDEWPEKWLVSNLTDGSDELESAFKTDNDEFKDIIEDAQEADKHNEIYTIAEGLSLDTKYVLRVLSSWATKEHSIMFNEPKNLISTFLE